MNSKNGKEVSYWRIATGGGGWNWAEERDVKVVSIGWTGFGSRPHPVEEVRSDPDTGDQGVRFVAVLEIPSVKDAETAVKVPIATEAKKGKP